MRFLSQENFGVQSDTICLHEIFPRASGKHKLFQYPFVMYSYLENMEGKVVGTSNHGSAIVVRELFQHEYIFNAFYRKGPGNFQSCFVTPSFEKRDPHFSVTLALRGKRW